MTQDLAVLLHGQVVGYVELELPIPKATFCYTREYLNEMASSPLSLSMPLNGQNHPIGDWLDGLLPPSLELRNRIGRAHGARSQHPVDLLALPIGRDCAGAVQFCRPADLPTVTNRESGEEPLQSDELEEILRKLRESTSSSSFILDKPPTFSLPGAQSKIALKRDSQGGWHLPHGNEPSTHILKVALTAWPSNDLVEHVCMSALRLAGIPTAFSSLVAFGVERAICVERYDRRKEADGTVRRVHQEDFCQATGIASHSKYQWAQGPGPADISKVLRSESDTPQQCLRRFRDALIANWVLLASDAHAKNYSVLIQGHTVRLAPLYDFCSVAPWRSAGVDRETIQMAMKSGPSYDANHMGPNEWKECAALLELPKQECLDRAVELAERLPPTVAQAAESLPPEYRDDLYVRELVSIMKTRTSQCLRLLGV